MADNTHTADNSNYINMLTNAIGQQLFAYTYSGNILKNPDVTEKFKKSLIFLGKEGQIYNPLTGTYVGIGQTAYTNLSKYATNIEEKVDALNQALTSSMVSAIYANHDPNKEVFSYQADGMSFDTYRGIHATNEIIFRGLGDYDPETGARTGKSFLNVTDANATPTNQELLNSAYYVDKSIVGGPHATSGITVSLVKGANYYRFNFKGYNSDLHGITAVGSDKVIVQNVFVGATAPSDVINGKVNYTDGAYTINPSVVLDADTSFNKAITQLCGYLTREIPADDNDKIKLFSEYYEAALDSKGESQLYKNGRNEFIIDDKLTWSYISSAYAYTLDFAQKFTQTEVNRIYSEILGLEKGDDLIPVNAYVIKKVVADNSSYVYDETTGLFAPQDGDTTLLTDIVLNTDTKFYQKVYFNHVVNTTYKDVVSNSTDKDLTLESNDKTSPITIRQYQLNSADALLVTGSTAGSVDVYNTITDVTTTGATKLDTIELSLDAQPENLGTWSQLTTNVEYNYYLAPDKSGSQYSLDYFLKPVTSVDEVNENYDYVVINTKSSSSHNINISDGINTLKEVAYVLDIITNGNLDPNDPESSGIEMAYSIAKNHVDILKLDERLVKVEGGLNVVNNISHTDAGDHKFATLNIESNKYKTIDISSLSTEDAVLTDNIIANAWSSAYEYILEKTVEGNTTYISLLDSVILSYQQAYNSYVIHKDNGNDGLTEPIFADYCTNYDSANGDKLYIVEKTKLASVDPQLTAYVGDVKLGVDLTLAYTYTCNEYSHNDGEGFVAITLNEIPNNNKKLTIDIAVPAKLDGLNASAIDSNKSKYAAGDELDENTTLAEITALVENITGEEFAIGTGEARKFDADGKIIATGTNCTVNITIDDTVKNVYAKVTGVTYNLSNSTPSILTDNGFDGNLYSSNVGGGTVVADDSQLYNNTVYYLRYSRNNTSIKFANTEVDGLTSSEWVKAYTGQVVNDIKNELAVANVNSYNYAASLLTKLDSNVKVETGEVIDTISVVDGKISVTSKELPTDKVVVMDVITGENGDTTHNQYELVTDYTTVDLATTSLYIVEGTRLKLHEATGADLADDVNVFDKNNELLSHDADHVKDSYKFGKNYANYIPLYTQETAYKLIDNADLTFNTDYSIASYKGTETSIYKISTQVVNTEYITAEFVHNDKLSGGNGGNTLHLTTHITKLVDASANNKGFADAYDVKQTLNNLFEWVDLDDLLDNIPTTENP